MQQWSGNLAKYRGLKGRRGEILHVVKKSAKVGPCEGGSESAMPACLAKQISWTQSMLQYTSLIIHDVCVKKPMCVSLHG